MANPKLVGELKSRLAAIREAHFGDEAPPNRFEDVLKKGAAALPSLIENTKSDDVSERIDALRAIGIIHENDRATKESLDAVLAVAKGKAELDDEMRSALFAIGKSRHPQLVHGYCEVLGADSAHAVVAACTVLGYAQWTQAVEYLKFVVQTDDDRTAPTAIWALGQIGSIDALPTLHHALINGRHPRWIPGALGDIGDLSSLEVLATVLRDPHPDIRFFAAMAIRAIIEAQSGPAFKTDAAWIVPELQAVSNSDRYAPTRVSALVTLARLGVPLEEEHVRRVVGLDAEKLFTGREAFYLSRGN